MSSEQAKVWHTAPVDNSILIAIEGIDGAGKTTQTKLLVDALRSVGLEVVQSKEPTNGAHGARIRESASSGRMSLDEELAAFVEDRKEHVNSLINPALEAGKIVVLDRYYYSTIAYQGARGANIESIRSAMEEFAPVPDVVFLLDVNAALGLDRIANERREAPNQFEELESLGKVRAVFNSLPDSNLAKIDGSQSREAVHERILNIIVDGPLRSRFCAKEYGCDDPTHSTSQFTGQCRWWKLAKKIRARFQQEPSTHRDPTPSAWSRQIESLE